MARLDRVSREGAAVEVSELLKMSTIAPEGYSWVKETLDTGYDVVVQGYPVIPQLVPLLNGFLKGMPNAKIFPRNWGSISTGYGMVRCATEMFVYLEDCPITLGAMGWKDYAVGRAHYGFGITSRKIKNEKYAPHRSQYYTALSDSADKSVKNALKYIRPFTHQELAGIYYENMQDQVRTHKEKPTSNLRSVVATLTNHAVLYEELAYLNSLGIEFKTSAFQQAASKIQELAAEVRESEARKIDGIFVRIRRVGEDRYADFITASDVDKNYRALWRDQGASGTCPIDDLPYAIAGKISTLSILEDGGYVPRVGQKIDEYTYWVEQDREIM